MKNWLLYFFIFSVVLCFLPFAALQTFGQPKMKLSVYENGEICDIDLEEFTYRALLKSGIECSLETKKALAVALRSCGAYISVNGCKHYEYDLCTKGDCCFELGRESDFDSTYIEECKKALNETKGEVLFYESSPAMALQCICASSGTAELKEYPYLSAIPQENPCEKHKTQLDFTIEEFNEKLRLENPVSMETIREDSFVAYGENKKCSLAVFGGKVIEGNFILKALNLPSPEFYINYNRNRIQLTCYGLGMGYGLNLCGAEKLFKQGRDYKEILEYYFPKLKKLNIYCLER